MKNNLVIPLLSYQKKYLTCIQHLVHRLYIYISTQVTWFFFISKRRVKILNVFFKKNLLQRPPKDPMVVKLFLMWGAPLRRLPPNTKQEKWEGWNLCSYSPLPCLLSPPADWLCSTSLSLSLPAFPLHLLIPHPSRFLLVFSTTSPRPRPLSLQSPLLALTSSGMPMSLISAP